MLAPKYRLYAFLGICTGLVILSSLGAILISPIWGLLLPIPLMVLAYLFRRMFLPSMSGQTHVRLGSLSVLYTASTLYMFPTNSLSSYLMSIVSKILIYLDVNESVSAVPPNASIIFLILIAVVILNLIWQKKDVIQPAENPDSEIEKAKTSDYYASLKRYTRALISELDRYDRDVNWSDSELTPLEAEIESEKTNKLRRKVVSDVVGAIRRNRDSSIFIMLGDPGAGKSVSLRRLVRVLCQRAHSSGVVPVYVNLREFPTDIKPTTESILTFIKEMALLQTGRDGRAFIDAWYDLFRRTGRLFFVIDSFDEMPSVLDCDDKSDSHKEISSTFDRFFTQEIQSCRAILASRHFRAPSGVKGTRLLIRPFKEIQIRKAMEKWLLGKGINTNRYVKKLFKERPQLAPLLRNPFTAELIAEYARSGTGDNLPDNMYSIFNNYIERRLETDLPTHGRLSLTKEEVRSAASTIAFKMYESTELGLEADVSKILDILQQAGHEKEVSENIVEALRYSRIARVGGFNSKKFSFVHRRFAEFFVVDDFKKKGEIIGKEDIPTDSRWRDCLVMYCGVASLDVRKEFANYCWTKIETALPLMMDGKFEEARNAIHCLRFLTDAFRADEEAVADFRDELGTVILNLINSNDPLVAKIGSEGIPLLSEESQQAAIKIAFQEGSRWVCDSTLRSCRHLGRLGEETHKAIRRYLASIPCTELFTQFFDINFSLSLSDSFRKQRYAVWADLVETILIFGITFSIYLTTMLFAPFWFVLNVFLGLFCALFMMGIKESNENYRQLRQDKTKHSLIARGIVSLNVYTIFSMSFFKRDSYSGAARLFVLFFIMTIAVLIREELRKLGAETPEVTASLFVSNPILDNFSMYNDVKEIYANLNFSAPEGFLLFFDRLKIKFLLVSALFLFLGWEFFFGLVTLIISLPKYSLKRIMTSVLKVFLPMGCMITAFGGVLFLFFTLWELIPQAVRDKIIFYAEMLQPCFMVISIGAILFVVVGIVFVTVNEYVELRKMRRIGLPEVATCESIYNTCLSYRCSNVRKKYLERVRLSQIPISGSAIAPPEELEKKSSLKEEIARLREQWYGLSN